MVFFQAYVLLWTTLLREVRNGHHRDPPSASRNRNQEQQHGFPDTDLFNTSLHAEMTLTKIEDKCLLAGKGGLKQHALIQEEAENL